jgi:hypothetical protein
MQHILTLTWECSEILAQELINGQERVHAGTAVTVLPHKYGRTRCHLDASGHKLQRRLIPQSIHPSVAALQCVQCR